MANEVKEVAEISKKDIATSVLSRLASLQETGEYKVFANYSAENAVRSAILHLQNSTTNDGKKYLEVCSQESIGMALFDMVNKGLSVAKNQCYFIPRGGKLCFEQSYFGDIHVAKRDAGVVDVNANVIYKGDDFKYKINPSTGKREIVSHNQEFTNIDNDNIVGAYAIVKFSDGSTNVEIMTMPQIIKSWEQSPMKGNSPAHKNFKDQMAKKTVIGRALKIEIATTDDSVLMGQNQTNTEKTVAIEISENANKVEVSPFEEETSAELVEEKPKAKTKSSNPFADEQ
jgi:recombination protein RecT